MKTCAACIVLIVICLPNSETRANGLIQKLPQDGSWVRYHTRINIEKPQKTEFTGTLTIRSVGRKTVNNEPCRWIEFDMTMNIENRTERTISKILVPEKLFKSEKSVSPKVIRGWIKRNDADPKEETDTEKLSSDEFAAFLPDPSRKVKTVKVKKTVDYQKGQLTVESAITGSVKLPVPENAKIKIESTFDFTMWSHEKVPFGTAEAKWEFSSKLEDQLLSKGTVTLTLEDFGTGAKSALPDHN
ncbi:MAG: hypothetical protein IH899_06465 [Planctomycetes bacterium]|nr:hypothetical protein [Planctomycetota bacterium]